MQLPLENGVSPGQQTELEGSLERIVYANEENAWSVVRLTVSGKREPVTAVGNLLGVQPGENLRLTGCWVDDPRHGRQFRVTSYATLVPATAAGIEKYLGSGLIRGIGKVMASRLVASFGLETLEVIEHHPERLQEVEGIGPKRSSEILRAWVEQRDVKEVMVFLQSHGVSTHYAIKIYKAYGALATRWVRDNPYRLAADIHGIGFATADRIAATLGISRTAPQRIAAGTLHVLAEAADRGHLFLPRARLIEEAEKLLESAPEQVGAAIGALAAAAEVIVESLPGERPGKAERSAGASAPIAAGAPPREAADEAVYLPQLHASEVGIASRLRALLAQPPLPLAIDQERALDWFERSQQLTLAAQQRQAIRRGISSKLLVVTGGPGTGKTTLVRGLVQILSRKAQRVLLAAPTGRAAKRLAEATGAEASTIHRLLEWNPHSRAFDRHRERPLACDLLIVDEASMLDSLLAYHLLKALPDSGRLVLVGDVDQLPSVGPGQVLADLIRSQAVEVVRLTEIFRQAERSLIVVNAHRVQSGQMPVLESAEPDGDFFFFDRREPEEVLQTIVRLVAERIPARFGLDPYEQIQVLTPMKRGLLGSAHLNSVLRDVLNPEGKTITRGGHSLRVGDKVMQVRNNYDLEVWNGDIGRVTAIDEVDHLLRVSFDGRAVAYDFAALDELALAYACSIHKAQGSEYPCVVIPLHSQHYVMLERNLLYTGITRAKRLAILVGEPKALATAVSNRRVRSRYTRLAERLAAAANDAAPPL
ncbi:MAG TPA: ATP-dependent RecD-like DNA helicase [Thermoanaerobaculia bacterium]|nr:ATP-dependent RecD-like DNA helicase [Thermoanaerobaculia bacterium]